MTIANSIVLADNAYGTIGSGLAVGDTALAFTTGHGARFPTVAAGQVLYCCILNSTNVLEEVAITAHSSGSDSATIVRAAGSTTAKVWTAGDRIEARMSSTTLKRLQDEAFKKTTIATADAGVTYTGTMTNTALGYVTGLVYALVAATTNSVVAPTIALDGLSAITVVRDGGGALVVGEMPVNGLYYFDGTNFILINPLIGQYSTGSTASTFTFNGSGGSTSSLTLSWQKVKNFVTLNIPVALATTGTGSTLLVSDTALPAAIRPTIAQYFAVNNTNNAAAASNVAAILSLSTNGILSLARDNIGTAWTNAQSGGLPGGITFTYFIG